MAKMTRFLSMGRAWFRKAWKAQENVELSLPFVGVSLRVRLGDEPVETRRGRDPGDTAPFYEMDVARLQAWHAGYPSGYERRNRLLYADLLAFEARGMTPVSRRSVRVEDVRVDLLPVPFRLHPDLQPHARQAVEFFRELGRIKRDPATGAEENNHALRLTGITAEGEFLCEPFRYFDQIATNLTVDWDSGALPKGVATIRSGLERPVEGRLPPLDQSILANNLGTAVMFYDRTLTRMRLRQRSGTLGSINHSGLHCTVSGVLEPPQGIARGRHGFEVFLHGTCKEIRDETNLEPKDYLLYPVADARELPRAGKPQLFFLAVALVDDETFRKECLKARESAEFIAGPEGAFREELPPGTALPDLYTYEGWAAQILAEDFLRANEAAIRADIAAATAP